jgi:hypothetical protein
MGLWANGFVSLVLVVLTVGAVGLQVAKEIVGPVKLAFQIGFVAHEVFALWGYGAGRFLGVEAVGDKLFY